ncbi:MAG TPA: hypothetical protein PLG73_11805 [Candidatus Sumerlaeota bacterium]|nr:hypothetical protein [Candidatus Sumerlaeota bacterium]
MVMQGYDRNGAFQDHEVLSDVNRATYFVMVKGNPRYLAMVVFNWRREGSSCPAHPAPQWGHGREFPTPATLADTEAREADP